AAFQPDARAPRRIRHELDDVAAGCALIAFEEPAELALEAPHIQRTARLTHAPPEPLEPGFDPAGKALVHRALFFAALDGPDQDEGLHPSGPTHGRGVGAVAGEHLVANRHPVATDDEGAA